MKYIALLAVILITYSACNNAGNSSASFPVEHETAIGAVASTVADIGVDGMTCAIGCAKMLEKKLAATEGVTIATVDFDAKLATIEYDKTKIKDKQIVALIQELNSGQYQVTSVKITETEAEEKEVEKKDSDGNDDELVEAILPSYKIKFPNIFDAISKMVKL